MSLTRLKWYAARLAAMSPAEVLHRMREAGLKAVSKRETAGWGRFSAIADEQFADLGWLGRRLALAPARAPHPPGQYSGLGRTVATDDPACWFRDPVSGGVWPSEPYCFDIDVRSTGKERGDVKFVWEINRLQMLHPLAADVAAGRADADVLLSILRDWATANPPYRGVNWFSGIELAMRLVSITLVIAAIPAERLQAGNRIFLRQLIAAHAYWLQRYPSRFSSANNHLVAEGLGLLLAGLVAPDLPDAAAWVAEGRHILEAEAERQIFADGVGAEQSPTYQAFTMEMLAIGTLMAREAGLPLATIVDDRLRAGALFLRALMDDAGQPPRIGDDDEGRVIAAQPDREPRYVASVVASVAGLAGDAALLPPARDPHLRDAIFAVPAGAATTEPGVHNFAAGGYTIIREAIAGRLAVLTFDHGPLGYLTLAAHGHADALALWLSLDGQPVLVDAGTYLYHSGGTLRNALRGSPAHNTLTIGGTSFAQPSSAFSWKSRPQARLDTLTPGPQWAVSASHDGYAKLHHARHRRSLRREGTDIVIADGLEGLGPGSTLPVEIAFLLDPSLEAEVFPGGVVVRAQSRPLLTLTAPAGFAIRIRREETLTGRGLFSARFGDIEPTVQIVLAGPLGQASVETRLTVAP